MTPSEVPMIFPLVVSGKTRDALYAEASRLRDTLSNVPSEALARFCFDRLGETLDPHRGIVLASDHAGFEQGLTRLSQGRAGRDVFLGIAAPREAVFVFPGQAAAWGGMGAGLYATSHKFRDSVAQAGAWLAPVFGWNPADIIATGEAVEGLTRIQPVQFVLATALSALWRHFNVGPQATLGHSVGEVAATHLAGYLTDHEATRLLAMWGAALGQIEGQGAMASVSTDAAHAARLIAPWAETIGIAAYNSPRNVTISGERQALSDMLRAAGEAKIWAQIVPGIEVAGHSSQVEPLRDTILKDAPSTATGRPTANFWSTVHARSMPVQAINQEYWYEALREPVRFDETVRALAARGAPLFIEPSAHPVLTTAIEETLRADGTEGIVIGSLDRRRDDRHAFLSAVSRACVSGASIHWGNVFNELLPGLAVMSAGVHPAKGAAIPPVVSSDDTRIDVAALARLPQERQEEVLRNLIVAEASTVLNRPFPVDIRSFADAGFDSLAVVDFIQALGANTGLDLPTTLLYDQTSPDDLIAHLRRELGLDARAAKLEAAPVAYDPQEPIAIIGMACRYPGGVVDPAGLWELVRSGRCAVGDLPADRGWDLSALYDPEPGAWGKISSRKGGFLSGVADFDAAFFGIAPREAAAMEPQQRLLLETAWEAIESAGIDPAACKGRNIGVFSGVIGMEYGPPLHRTAQDAAGYAFLGTASCVASGRVSYALGLEGPALAIDTACSSSLVAIHTACDALRNGDCEMALAGGATIMSTPGVLVEFSRQRVLAADGCCKAFSASADGIGLGEGVGMLLLAPLSTAKAHNLPVMGLIRGSAVNQDGASNGLSAPSGTAQARVIRHALAKTGLTAGDVDVIEAHGTGTRLGDPIEAHALLSTYGQGRAEGAPIYLGSLKSNVAHTQAAAGVGGVIKMVMAMRHGSLPPSLHITAPSDQIAWSTGRIELLSRARAWPDRADGPRRAAVSSFGVSGTNAHLILEAPSDMAVEASAGPGFMPILWPIAARSSNALHQVARRLRAHVTRSPDLDPVSIARTLGLSRARAPYRAAVWGNDRDQLLNALDALIDEQEHAGAIAGQEVRNGKLIFVFPGQGSQWPRMGMALAERSLHFRQALAEIDAALLPHTGWSVLDVLRGERGAPSMERVDVVQPALFAIMVSLARIWASFGIVPSAVIGHSQGEIVAAHVAGILELEQAARIVAVRSRVLQEAEAARGAMANLFVTEAQARDLIAPYGDALVLATLNSPRAFGVSGETAAIDALVRHCAEQNIPAKRIAGNVAPHAPKLASLRSDLARQIGTIAARPGTIAFYSSVETYVSAEPIEGTRLDMDYWCDNLCRQVRFADAIAAMPTDGGVFLECSPHPVLLPPLEECLGPDAVVIASLQRIRDAGACLAESLGRLYASGHQPDWHALYPQAGFAELPTYPFERQRYWIAPEIATDATSIGQQEAGHSLLSAIIDLPDGEGILATGRLALATHPWLADHAASGVVILPGMAYLDLVLHTGKFLGCAHVAELTLHAPIRLDLETAQDLRLKIGREEEDGQRPFTLHARISGDVDLNPWVLHASGHLSATAAVIDAAPVQVWPPEGAREIDIGNLRDRLVAAGYDYGPNFRGLEKAWRLGSDIFVEARLPSGLSPAGHTIHPALLDTALHPIALTDDEASSVLRLPFSLSNVTSLGRASHTLRASLRRETDDRIAVTVFDADGMPMLNIGSLTLRALGEQALRRLSAPRAEQDLLETIWTAVPQSSTDDVPPDGAVLATMQEAARHPALSGWRMHDGIAELVRAIDTGSAAPALLVWPIPVPPMADQSPALRAQYWCEAVTAELQAWLGDARLARTRIVALMSNAVASNPDACPDTGAAAVWQLLHSAQNEDPGRLILLDVQEPLATFAPIVALLKMERAQGAWRNGALLAPSLRRPASTSSLPHSMYWRLDVGPAGGLDSLLFRETPETGRDLQSGEVRIAVRAAGLNFYDTVYALGLIPLQQAFGAEAAGIVVAIGPDVTRVSVGDRAMAMAEGAYGPFLIADQRLVVRIDDRWTFAQAAGIPAAYVTAYRAITEVAVAKPGERILIHAGAGGVGQAAIQIAQQQGLEVFATAHPSKWPVLRQLGLAADHIASSRDLDFARAFRDVSGDQGMDVVLNSLAGPFTDATLDLTAKGGRIVELGKADIRSVETLATSHPHLSYRHLDGRAALEPDRTAEVLDELWTLLSAGKLTPLPVTGFDIRDADRAFRLMQYGRHTGKIVLTIPRALDASGTVLITGGTGTLGTLLARHLVETQGIRSLLLTSRRGPEAVGAQELARDLEASGVRVRIEACDVADPQALARVLASVPEEAPLTGVFHAAGTLADATITRLTAENFATVFHPKAEAAWHLHEMTRQYDLAAFVLYSSTAGTLGNPGQGNYAAANAFLDALARQRRREGLPAHALGWGWWQPASGMTRGENAADDARIARTGLAPITAEYGNALLDAGLACVRPAVLAAPVTLSTLRANARAGTIHPLFAELAGGTHADEQSRAGAQVLRGKLASQSERARHRHLLALIGEHVANIVGLVDGSSISPETSFRDAGLDSLMALELRNRLARATGLRLPATLIYDHPTPGVLATHLNTSLFPDDTPHATEGLGATHPPEEDQRARDALATLSPQTLRDAGLLDALLRLAASAPPPANSREQTRAARSASDIHAASVDELLALAMAEEDDAS